MPLNYSTATAASCGCEEVYECLKSLCDNVLNLTLMQGATDEIEIFLVGDRVQIAALNTPNVITTQGKNCIQDATAIKLICYDEPCGVSADLYSVSGSTATSLTVTPNLPIDANQSFTSLVQMVPGCPVEDMADPPTAIAILDTEGVTMFGNIVTRFCADPVFFAALTYAGARTVTFSDSKNAESLARQIYPGDLVTIASAGITNAKVLRVAESYPGTWYLELDAAATKEGCFQGVAEQEKLGGILSVEPTANGFRVLFDLSAFKCNDAAAFGCHDEALQKFRVGHYTLFAQWVDDDRNVVRRYPVLHGILDAVATAV